MLNSDIDMVEEQNKQIAKEINYHVNLQKMTETDKADLKDKIRVEIEESRQLNREKEEMIRVIEDQMKQIKDFA
jgi:hypothetical protein